MVCCKQSTTAYNTTETEFLDTAPTLTKQVLWLRAFMDDLGLPCSDALFIGEDNPAEKVNAHAGLGHIATNTMALQDVWGDMSVWVLVWLATSK